jgi:hypothetical protein
MIRPLASIVSSVCLSLSFAGMMALGATTNPVFAQTIFAKLESVNYPQRFIRHRNWLGYLEPISTDLDEADSSFRIRTGLADPNCISLESKNFPGHFLRHQNWRIRLSQNDSSTLFRKDATFCQRSGLSPKGGRSFESYNYPGYFIRHRDFELWLDKFDGSKLFRDDASFLRRAAA